MGAKRVDVALKTLKDTSSINKKVKFLQEAAIMAQFNHPNVIALHGLVNYDQVSSLATNSPIPLHSTPSNSLPSPPNNSPTNLPSIGRASELCSG